MSWKDAAQFHEKCGDCGHTQNYHIGVEEGYMTGRMVECRFAACECAKWVPTWGVKKVSA